MIRLSACKDSFETASEKLYRRHMNGIRWLAVLVGMIACTSHASLPAEPESGSGQTRVIGHRGSPAYGNENTFAGFRRAVELGADGLELDVILTADNKLAVIHDWELNRLIGEEQLRDRFPDRVHRIDDKPVWLTRDFTLDELRSLEVVQRGPRSKEATRIHNESELHVCGYDEALGLFTELRDSNHQLVLYTEIKTSDAYLSDDEIDLLADLVAEYLTSHGELEYPASHWLQSFDSRVMERLAADPRLASFPKAMLLSCEPGLTASAHPVVLDTNKIRTPEDLREFLREQVADRGLTMVHGWKLMWWRLIDGHGIDCAQVAHELGLQIHAFTFRDENYASDYKKHPELAPGEPRFPSAAEELAFFVTAGFDAVMSDSVDTAVQATHTRTPAGK